MLNQEHERNLFLKKIKKQSEKTLQAGPVAVGK
jgi:hypothetical protein